MMLDILKFNVDKLSMFIGIFIGVFSLLSLVYSIGFMKGKKGLLRYYAYMLLTTVASLGAVFANNLILFIVFWGFLGVTLYLLIGFGEKKNTQLTAKKTLIIIGGSDAFMILGLALIWRITGTFDMSKMSIALTDKTAVYAYLCLAAGAFAKAGAMPFHTWLTDTAEDAPTPVTAFIPASLDKLLGIYFLARISMNMFEMNTAMNTFLMAVGSITIVAAVMMALVQHDMKKLLGYHAVSQVGYMVLGIGTGNPIGIAGGLFHMLNHAVYKACLFMTGGAVEKRAGTTDLRKLGGYVRVMPVTFVAFLVASFAISGVPPFNGFVSKWMVYQGIIETASGGGKLWIVWLIAALFGSALTLASFMKLIHAIFLGQTGKEARETKIDGSQETAPSMLIPPVILATLCVLFGVFAYRLPLGKFIFPVLGGRGMIFAGMWSPGLATILLVLGIGIGFIIYLAGSALKARVVESFVGGEVLDEQPDMRLSGAEFYNNVGEIGFLKQMYYLAEKKVFDVYEIGKKLVFGFGGICGYLHNGVLSTYLAWCLLGGGILLYVLVR